MLCLCLSFPGGSLQAAPDCNCYEISPWAGVKEETMPAALSRPLKQLSCRGLREDWVTAVVGVKSLTANYRLTVSLDAPQDLKEKIALRMGHWQAFKYDVKGLGIFAGYDSQGDPWNDLDKANDYYLYYWYGKDGFLTTHAFEAYRQGVQEYRLLDALRKAGVPQKWLDQ
ncbi:MAG: hypothetical protein IT210_11220 [Armatimonadetes bacterium]|nr:hypothetical protein [Armatimonadota bacterium]